MGDFNPKARNHLIIYQKKKTTFINAQALNGANYKPTKTMREQKFIIWYIMILEYGKILESRQLYTSCTL